MRSGKTRLAVELARLLSKQGKRVGHERGATEEYWCEFHAGTAEFYGHVLGLKGPERSIVMLCVNGFKDIERAAEQLYVGLSLARSLLVVVGDFGLHEESGGGG